MEIREIRTTETHESITKCEITVGNVSVRARQIAVKKTGYDFPRFYIDVEYDLSTGEARFIEYESGDTAYSLYTRGKTGTIIPLEYNLTDISKKELSKIVSAYVKNNKESI